MMPTVNKDVLESKLLSVDTTVYTLEEIRTLIDLVVKRDGSVRASKPNLKNLTGFESEQAGRAAYIWRMVVFMVSTKGAHQCMPICADFDLPAKDETGRWSSSIARTMAKQLDKIVDVIVDSVPARKRHGLIRWGHALGYSA